MLNQLTSGVLRRFTRAWTLVLATPCLVGCVPAEPELNPDTSITIGLLLPFTGASAATANNFERSVLYAAERVNDAGGIHGKTIRIVARDTHSDVERSLKSVEELIDEGAVAVIGPESPEVAEAIRTRLNEEGVGFISPLVGEGEVVDLNCEYPWYRLAPSAKALGENLANDLAEGGFSEIAILYGAGEYNNAFRRAVRDKFEGNLLEKTVLIERALPDDGSGQTALLREVLETNPDAIVLSASPQTGAVAFTEANLLGVGEATWAFSPLLKTPLFLQNINTHDARGALGIAPKIFDTTGEFPAAFSQRWSGDVPLEGAYFYYDAVGLLTVTFGLLGPDDYSYDELKDAIVRASSSRGVSIGWDELESGLTHLEEGRESYYSGLTGPMLLQDCGNRRSGQTQAWTISDGEIQEVTP